MDTPDGNNSANKPKIGRPEGSYNKNSELAKARRWAQQTGEMPHEFLLRISRGEPIELQEVDPIMPGHYIRKTYCPTFDDRRKAAVDCAPYFAPKFATVEIVQTLQDIPDDELDQIIAESAAACRAGNGPEGEGTQEQEVRSTRRRLNRSNSD